MREWTLGASFRNAIVTVFSKAEEIREKGKPCQSHMFDCPFREKGGNLDSYTGTLWSGSSAVVMEG